MYKGKNVLVMVSGSVAAYKTATLIRLLVKSGAQVRVGMTRSAQEFITSKTLAILSGHEVLTDLFSADQSAEVIHIEWAKWADLIFVVPATANLIGKIAQGLADDAVTATIMASSADKIIAPAMNDVMLRNGAVVRNMDILSADGWLVISPVTGFLAEGYEAKGRLPEPSDILQQATIRLRAKSGQLVGKKVLITAGGTREALDPVRYLTNRSSGKMGYALALAAVENGAHVFLITTVDRGDIFGVKKIQVDSTQDMYEETRRLFPDMDIFIGAAAVSDFKAAHLAEHKIKKQSDTGLILELTQNPDILKAVGHDKTKQQIVVGFAAETQNIVTYGQDKLAKKHADMLVVNDVGQADSGFSSDNNAVTILMPDHEPEALGKASKIEIARDIIKRISALK